MVDWCLTKLVLRLDEDGLNWDSKKWFRNFSKDHSRFFFTKCFELQSIQKSVQIAQWTISFQICPNLHYDNLKDEKNIRILILYLAAPYIQRKNEKISLRSSLSPICLKKWQILDISQGCQRFNPKGGEAKKGQYIWFYGCWMGPYCFKDMKAKKWKML